MTNPSFVQTPQGPIGYRTTGSGPDIVFIHGWPLHRETWRNVVRHLPDYTCHLIDLPGSGTSRHPTVTPALRTHVDAVLELLETLGLDNPALAGHDSGGMIARFVAVRMAKMPPALLLSGTEIPFHHPPQIEELQRSARLPGSVMVTKFMMNSPRIARSNRVLGGCFFDRDLIEGDFRTAVLDPVFSSRAAVKHQLSTLASYSTDLVDELAEVHPRITCPSLFIWGADDRFFPVEDAKAMTGQFGGPTRFEVVDQAGLLVHEEHPQRFAKRCAAFLADVAAESV